MSRSTSTRTRKQTNNANPAITFEAMGVPVPSFEATYTTQAQPALQRRNALRVPSGFKVQVVQEVDGPSLTRSNAVRRPQNPRTMSGANAKQEGSKKQSKLTDVFAITKPAQSQDGPRASGAHPQTEKARRPSRFVEHMSEESEKKSVRSTASKTGMARRMEKMKESLKKGWKDATDLRPSFTGVRMYEGT